MGKRVFTLCVLAEHNLYHDALPVPAGAVQSPSAEAA